MSFKEEAPVLECCHRVEEGGGINVALFAGESNVVATVRPDKDEYLELLLLRVCILPRRLGREWRALR